MTETALREYSRLMEETGLVELSEFANDGMLCKFCVSSDKQIKYILVYEDRSKLCNLIADEKRFSQFNRAIYLHDLKIEGVFAEVFIIYLAAGNSTNIPVQKIEANKTYARKYVFFTREAITFINGVRLVDQSGIATSDNPLHVWADTLGKVGLTGCLSEPYFARNVSAYLDGSDFNSDTLFDDNYEISEDTQFPVVKWIKSLDTKGFRKFCFNDVRMDFGQVNLFYGANGSGKSSVLEAIEFALTSEIGRMTDFKVTNSKSRVPVVSAYTKDAAVIRFTPQDSNRNARGIERAWYGVPLSRSKSTLNSNFARFNSFDSEAAYNFVHNTDSSNSSFAEAFGNLLFGEKVIDSEKKWRRYQMAFQTALSDVEKQIQAAEPELASIKALFAQASAEGYSKELERMIREIHYKRSESLPQEVIQRYQAVSEELSGIYEVARPLESSDTLAEKSFKEARTIISSAKQRNTELLRKKREIDKEIEKCNIELRELSGQRVKLQRQRSEASGEYYELLHSESGWLSMQRILESDDKLSLFDELYQQKYDIQRRLDGIDALRENRILGQFFARGKFEDVDNESLINTKQRKENLERDLRAIEAKLEKRKSMMSMHEAQFLEIRKLGKLLATGSKCPLCGHEYESNSELLELIEKANTSDTEAEKLLQKMAKCRREINECNEILEYKELRDSAIVQLLEMRSLVPEIEKYGTDLKKIHQYMNSEEQIKKELLTTLSRIETLEKDGFSQRSVNDARSYKLVDPHYLEFCEMSSYENDYFLWLRDRVEEESKKRDQYKLDLEMIEKKKAVAEEKIELQKIEREKVELQLRNIPVKELYTAEAALKEIDRVFDLDPSETVYKWVQKVQIFKRKLSAELDRLDHESTYGKTMMEMERLSKLLNTLKAQKKRILQALKAFDKMPSLSSFVEESIRENIERISKFFKWMHHSGEFRELGVDSEGIYAIRDMDQQIVRIYEMSTGQRAAMALSVMLAFHSAASSAPEFILLDEPLATMDDIQVMNVLDILKDLVKNGTQIFFTSANEEMIRLFKNAFANTDFDYKEFEFIKRINNSSIINEHNVNVAPSLEELTLDDITLDFSQLNDIRRILSKNQEKLSAKQVE